MFGRGHFHLLTDLQDFGSFGCWGSVTISQVISIWLEAHLRNRVVRGIGYLPCTSRPAQAVGSSLFCRMLALVAQVVLTS